jgi:hypothetical protein
MKELIERLENAEGPSDELDEAIARATAPLPDGYGASPYTTTGIWVFKGDPRFAYTRSIDSALTLLPPDYWWEIRQLCAPTSPMRSFGRNGIFMAAAHKSYGESGIAGSHDVPAIALCISILRAREALQRPPVRTGEE